MKGSQKPSNRIEPIPDAPTTPAGKSNQLQQRPLTQPEPAARSTPTHTLDYYKFIKVEDLFAQAMEWESLTQVTGYQVDQAHKTLTLSIESNTGGSYALQLQFLRKDILRYRFNPAFGADASRYQSGNTRAVVMDSYEELSEELQGASGLQLEVKEDAGGALEVLAKEAGRAFTRVLIDRQQFRTTVFQYKESGEAFKVLEDRAPGIFFALNEGGPREYTVVQAKKKPGTARYMGFGEHGGSGLFKNSGQLTFFNYDNFQARRVYNRGALESREPLYHSNPFFLEAYGVPNEDFVYGIFIDNPSQVVVDVGYANSFQYMFGTRFRGLDYYVFLGTNVESILKSYTDIVGTAPLFPRYVLGYHQGCYGYDSRDKLLEVAHQYRQAQIPLDGLHIDVDIQKNYQTFTIDEGKFPRPQEMFSQLRDMGIKCSTNITPIISNKDPSYATCREGLEKRYFVMDQREGVKGQDPSGERYQYYTGGQEQTVGFPSGCNFNDGEPYTGMVNYGGDRKINGHYPDLGRKEVREWWGRQYQSLFDAGLEMVWQDMTTPAIDPSYGDMYSFPYKLLLTDDFLKATEDDDASPSGGQGQYTQSAAIRTWTLYSHNLHKATYHGLNHLESRQNKRNFIIGRGSYAGAHRFGGLWTGDNASSWDFLRVCVPQVLASGMSGQAINGADVGGFAWDVDRQPWQQWADPELVIRWMTMAAFFPWFRNHYFQKDQKLFQEPYAYAQVDTRGMSDEARAMHGAVLPVCKHYIELRYRLLQLFYDRMFESMLTGLPICRPLFLENWDDKSLLNDKHDSNSTQFMVGRDLLIAPILEKQDSSNAGGKRDVYLPFGSNWYCFMDNRRPLSKPVEGGSTVRDFDAHIDTSSEHMGFLVPAYVRSGAIIPTIELEQYVGQRNREGKKNPITLNTYPGDRFPRLKRDGKDPKNEYTLYLDDGSSRSSAPKGQKETGYDPQAKGEYREVKVSHRFVNESPRVREVKVERLHDGYTPMEDFFFVALLHEPADGHADSGPLTEVRINGEVISPLTGGSAEERAARLGASDRNAWYYNEGVRISFVKVFDKPEALTVSATYR